MAKYRVPSQAANGGQTFSDNLVGLQITNGSSQLTNTNFDFYKVVTDKDNKNFTNGDFSDFITLDNLNSLTTLPEKKIKFRNDSDNAARSLYGSLFERLKVSISNIINNFPAGLYVDNTSIFKTKDETVFNINYNNLYKTTEFYIEKSVIYNPFDIIFETPKSEIKPEVVNTLRNFYTAYNEYVLDYSGKTYNIINYTEPDENNIIKITVNGKPFGTSTGLTENLLLRPNDTKNEEFYENLDDLEILLMNRETNPIYQATFKVPRDTYDGAEIIGVDVNWPISKDNWNLQITGIDYLLYIDKLNVLANEIDDYKSNLIIRFLTAPQLFEFDTENKHAESVFQLYGQNFDFIKKYIDNIALMRNVSYDGINNIPDLLLKNLSENLGFNSFNLFDEKSFNDILYTRLNSSYSGMTVGKNLIESEYEFYRRLLTNLSHIYRSKGTRKSLEFFLRFLGAPEPMIKINEYVYEVTELPNVSTLNDDLYDLIQGLKIETEITEFSELLYSYTTKEVTGTTTSIRDEYPIDKNGLPRKNTNNLIFFQKGNGWYDITLDHRPSTIIDPVNSVLTGKTKSIKTINKPRTFGEDYFEYYRKLEGLDYGFEVKAKVDNKKITTERNKLILNRKNINVFLSSAQTVDYDIYRQSRNQNLSFGDMTPQYSISFADYLDNILNNYVKNSSTVKYENNYINLSNIYRDYLSKVSNPYDFISINEFIEKMSPNWVKVIEQFIPASTLWLGGNVIENSKFGRSKYKYRKPCQIFELIDDRYPDFQSVVDENPGYTLYKFYPMFTIDNVSYSGSTIYTQTSETVNLTTLKNSWDVTFSTLVEYMNVTIGFERNNVGKDNEYSETISNNDLYSDKIKSPILSFENFVNEEGLEKIRFRSYRYGPHSCTVNKNFNFQVIIEID